MYFYRIRVMVHVIICLQVRGLKYRLLFYHHRCSHRIDDLTDAQNSDNHPSIVEYFNVDFDLANPIQWEPPLRFVWK